jgi:hypothetical protein
MSETVCIETYATREEAEMAKGLLAEAGIEAMVSADDAGGMYPNVGFSAAGVKLLVLSEHAERAVDVLRGETEA